MKQRLSQLAQEESIQEEELHSAPIPLDEKILTLSATEYVAMIGKSLSDYTPAHVQGDIRNWRGNPAISLARSAPEGTEAVVNYRVITMVRPALTEEGEVEKIARDGAQIGVQYGIGTALVPKIKE